MKKDVYTREEMKEILAAVGIGEEDLPSLEEMTLMAIVSFAVSHKVMTQQKAAPLYVSRVFRGFAALTERELDRLLAAGGPLLASVTLENKPIFHDRSPEREEWGWVDVAKVFDTIRDKVAGIRERKRG